MYSDVEGKSDNFIFDSIDDEFFNDNYNYKQHLAIPENLPKDYIGFSTIINDYEEKLKDNIYNGTLECNILSMESEERSVVNMLLADSNSETQSTSNQSNITNIMGELICASSCNIDVAHEITWNAHKYRKDMMHQVQQYADELDIDNYKNKDVDKKQTVNINKDINTNKQYCNYEINEILKVHTNRKIVPLNEKNLKLLQNRYNHKNSTSTLKNSSVYNSSETENSFKQITEYNEQEDKNTEKEVLQILDNFNNMESDDDDNESIDAARMKQLNIIAETDIEQKKLSNVQDEIRRESLRKSTIVYTKEYIKNNQFNDIDYLSCEDDDDNNSKCDSLNLFCSKIKFDNNKRTIIDKLPNQNYNRHKNANSKLKILNQKLYEY